jgi:hypothetical protein
MRNVECGVKGSEDVATRGRWEALKIEVGKMGR